MQICGIQSRREPPATDAADFAILDGFCELPASDDFRNSHTTANMFVQRLQADQQAARIGCIEPVLPHLTASDRDRSLR